MFDPLIISPSQLHRLEMLTAMYLEYPKCGLASWGRPRGNNTCKVDVNRPVQYLSNDHDMKDCEKEHDGNTWAFEAAAMDLNGVPLSLDDTNVNSIVNATYMHEQKQPTTQNN